MKRQRTPRQPQTPALRVIVGNPNAEAAPEPPRSGDAELRGVYFTRSLIGGRRTLYSVDDRGEELERYTLAGCADEEWTDRVIVQMRRHLDIVCPGRRPLRLSEPGS